MNRYSPVTADTESGEMPFFNMLMGKLGNDAMNNHLLSTARRQLISAVKTKVKANFGKEYHITKENGYEGYVKSEIVNKFIAKYDKNFESHTQTSGNAKHAFLNDGLFIIRLGDTHNTYMYIASGANSTDISTRFITNRSVENGDMYIYIFGKHTYKYTKELEQIISNVYNVENLGIFTVDKSKNSRYDDEEGESIDIRFMPMQPRWPDTLFFSHKEFEKITAHIDRFIEHQESYKKHQLPYKTGILLYGTPGCGKSSIARAIATVYDRDIININVAHLMSIDLTRLTESINLDTYRSYIILLEDIDCLYLNREDADTDKDDAAVIYKLLNFLDGQSSPSDVIFIATTNYKDRLDSALLRPGRFDLHVETSELVESDVYRFGKSFELPDEYIKEIIEEYPEWLRESGRSANIDSDGHTLYNQSAIQGMILNKLEKKHRKVEIVDSSEVLKQQSIEDTEDNQTNGD